MPIIGRLTSAERASVVSAKQRGYLRPMSLDMAADWPTCVYVKTINGWVVRDTVGVVRDACGPIHRN